MRWVTLSKQAERIIERGMRGAGGPTHPGFSRPVRARFLVVERPRGDPGLHLGNRRCIQVRSAQWHPRARNAR